MTICLGNTFFVYKNGSWNLVVSKSLKSFQDENKTTEERTHKNLNRAIFAIGSKNSHYGLSSILDIQSYHKLKDAYKKAIVSIKKLLLLNESCERFSIPSKAIPDFEYTGISKSNGYALNYKHTTDNKRSISGFNIKCTYPGNFYQACEFILNIEVGEQMIKKENPSIHTLIETIKNVEKQLVSTIEIKKTI